MKHPPSSKDERGYFGTINETIKHYGKVTPRLDLHPHQIQPSHIVITSPWFDTSETYIGAGSRVRGWERERIRQRVLRMYDEGVLLENIAEGAGINVDSVIHILARYKA